MVVMLVKFLGGIRRCHSRAVVKNVIDPTGNRLLTGCNKIGNFMERKDIKLCSITSITDSCERMTEKYESMTHARHIFSVYIKTKYICVDN